jgi:hypothetical protein
MNYIANNTYYYPAGNISFSFPTSYIGYTTTNTSTYANNSLYWSTPSCYIPTFITNYNLVPCKWCKVDHKIFDYTTLNAAGFICPACIPLLKPYLRDITIDFDVMFGKTYAAESDWEKEINRLLNERCPQCQELHD